MRFSQPDADWKHLAALLEDMGLLERNVRTNSSRVVLKVLKSRRRCSSKLNSM
jgi:hypothetical protein